MKRSVFFSAAASAFVAIALPSSAYAQAKGAEGFGEKGTVAVHALTAAPLLSSDVQGFDLGATPILGFNTTTHDGPEDTRGGVTTQTSVRRTAFYINPRAHYFIIDRLSIGGEVLFASLSQTTIVKNGNQKTETTDDAPDAIGLMPVVGYDIPIGEKFSLWPQGGIGFRYAWFTHDNPAPADDTTFSESWWFFAADVPFMFHPVPHVALGVGPGVTVTLAKSQSAKTGSTTLTQDISTLQWRWLSASLVAWF